MENVLVSIIVPTYNVERYLKRAIESSLNQSYANIELILVDDGSTDHTWEVIEQYEKQDKRIISSKQKNSGVSVARNKGLCLAHGAYALFLDSDDWLETEAVETLMKLQALHPGKLIATDCFLARCDGDEKISKKRREQKKWEAEVSKEKSLMAIPEGKYRLSSSCYKLFSMEIIREAKMSFDEKIRHGEDGLFVFYYLQQADGLYYCTTPLWNILIRPGSATTGGYNQYWLTAIHAVNQMIEKTSDQPLRKKLYSLFVGRSLMVLFAAVKSDEDAHKDIAYIRKKLWEAAKYYLPGDNSMKAKILFIIALVAPIPVLKGYFLWKEKHREQPLA